MSRGEASVGKVEEQRAVDRTYQLRPKKIEEGDWVLVYESSLDNQHRATRKFARRWFGPYVVTGANDNGTYHLAELDGTRMVIPVVGKRVEAFKKRHDYEPDLGGMDSDDEQPEAEDEPVDEE